MFSSRKTSLPPPLTMWILAYTYVANALRWGNKYVATIMTCLRVDYVFYCHYTLYTHCMKMPEVTPATSTMECSSAIPYPEGGMCQSVLEATLLSMNCESGESLSVLRNEENNARLLFFALNQGSPSPECMAAVTPLLCVHLFGLCDSSGVSIQPTSGECRNIRDNLCSVEWQTAIMSGLDLPDCDIFPEEQASCTGRDSGSGSGSISKPDLTTHSSHTPLLPNRVLI